MGGAGFEAACKPALARCRGQHRGQHRDPRLGLVTCSGRATPDSRARGRRAARACRRPLVTRAERVFERPPAAQGTYQYEREDGTLVHGDTSGEWTLDEHGDLEDIVFFASPRWLRYGSKEKTE